VRPAAARGAEIAVWWVVLCGVWTLTLSAVTLQESVLAGVATLPAAATAVAARRAEKVAWRPALAWARWALVWPVAVVADAGRVLADAVRRRPGAFTDLDLPEEHGPRRSARRTFAALTLTSTPGAVVVDVPDEPRFTVHLLGRGRPHLERAVTR